MGSRFPPGPPVYWDRTCEYQRHPDFGFHIWQEVGNPPRSVGVPINQRRMTGFKITVKPEGRPPSEAIYPTITDLLRRIL